MEVLVSAGGALVEAAISFEAGVAAALWVRHFEAAAWLDRALLEGGFLEVGGIFDFFQWLLHFDRLDDWRARQLRHRRSLAFKLLNLRRFHR